MKSEVLAAHSFESIFLKRTPIIDVRAPIEFLEGSLPNSVNLPVLNNDERAKVGTEYKQAGPEAATKLGFGLVSNEIRVERIALWISFIAKNPNAVLCCFRGGKRSQISQSWIEEHGLSIPRIEGGYKAGRSFLLQRLTELSSDYNFLPVAGPTGSGKTILINEVKGFYPSIDLEKLAKHRGSAFGAYQDPQPSQIDFENQLAFRMLEVFAHYGKNLPPLVEDESRLIGKSVVPAILFEKINNSPVILIDEILERRVENIFQDYILDSPIAKGDEAAAARVFLKYKTSLQAISKKLGGERTKEVMDLLIYSEAEFQKGRKLDANRQWIEKLLVYYYDPLYLTSLKRRDVKILHKGDRKTCFDFIKVSVHS